MYFMGVLAIFKNEAHILEEWIEHYIKEGCDHFYLIDNDSTDNPEAILEKYSPRITVVRSSDRHAQIRLYNEMRDQIARECEWIAVVDLDEFMYTKTDTIAEYVRGQPDDVGQILATWINYGSSGYIEQPHLIIPSFLMHARIEIGTEMEVKGIIRTRMLRSFQVHGHDMREGHTISSDGTQINSADKIIQTENLIQNGKLWVNHYQIQSWEYFCSVKMLRGDAMNPMTENYRDEAYWNSRDKNEVRNVVLRDKKNLISK